MNDWEKYRLGREFWTEKLKEYGNIFYFYKKEKQPAEIDQDSDIQKLYDLLEEKFGKEKLYKEVLESTYRKKKYNIWTLRFFPDGSESRNKTGYDYMEITNSRVSHQYPAAFLLSCSGSKCFWSYCYCYDEIFKLFCKYSDDFVKNKEDLQAKLLEFEKDEKIKSVAKQSIKAIVESKMAGTGYQWNLKEEETRCVLSIKMKRGKMIEITLGYKTFTDKIPEMLEVIKQMENLLETIPYPVNIRSYGKNIEWGR